ncbi:MAG: AgmX/PglI C-terminal domain-containing protein [Deltaproteobacteria bacterium]|nr:AgmX/PglI C-terminal domain-containing protein [Deltaproteobacteria bacterium]
MPRRGFRSSTFVSLPLLAAAFAAACAPAEVPPHRRRPAPTVSAGPGAPAARLTCLPRGDGEAAKGRAPEVTRDVPTRATGEATGDPGAAAFVTLDADSANRPVPAARDAVGGVPPSPPLPRLAATGPRPPATPAAPDPAPVPAARMSAADRGLAPEEPPPPTAEAEKAEDLSQGLAHRPPVGPPGADEGRAEAAPEIVEGSGASSDVRRILRGQQAALQRCYDALQLRTPGTGGGMVTIRLTLDPAGQVQSVDIVGGTVDEVEFNRCVLDHLRRLAFPRADSTAIVTWPFRFGSGPAAPGIE